MTSICAINVCATAPFLFLKSLKLKGHPVENISKTFVPFKLINTNWSLTSVTDPKFVLLDEPFAGVDPIAVEDIQKIVSHLKKKNIGILITDHNVQETLAITDRTYLMFEGKILKSGIPEELAKDQMVRKLYLGENFEFMN